MTTAARWAAAVKKCLGKVLAVLDFYKFDGTVSTVPNSLCRDTVDKRPKHAYFDQI